MSTNQTAVILVRHEAGDNHPSYKILNSQSQDDFDVRQCGLLIILSSIDKRLKVVVCNEGGDSGVDDSDGALRNVKPGEWCRFRIRKLDPNCKSGSGSSSEHEIRIAYKGNDGKFRFIVSGVEVDVSGDREQQIRSMCMTDPGGAPGGPKMKVEDD